VAASGTLPAGRVDVWTRDPAGVDELFVLESVGPPHRTMRELAERLVTDAQGEPLAWRDLPAVDLAAAALFIRSVWIGATIRAEASCPAPGCGGDVEIAFSIDAYLDHHRPRPFRGVSEEEGWFALPRAEVRFKVLTLGELDTAMSDGTASADTLAASCIRPPAPNASTLRRVERALQALAPTLDGMVTGVCPLCGTQVQLWFPPIEFVLDELRGDSAGLFDEVHELARAYHWSEQEILRLDRSRRRGYVELVRTELVA
jgi:hypothetical protein